MSDTLLWDTRDLMYFGFRLLDLLSGYYTGKLSSQRAMWQETGAGGGGGGGIKTEGSVWVW